MLVFWAKLKVAGAGGVGTGEAGEGWTSGNFSVPGRTCKPPRKHVYFLSPQARDLTEEGEE